MEQQTWDQNKDQNQRQNQMQNQMQNQRQNQYDIVRSALDFLHPKIDGDHVVELCAFDCNGYSKLWQGLARGKTTSGWYSDAHKLAAMAVDLDMGWDNRGVLKTPSGVYITMNLADPALLGRANNRIIPGVDRTKNLEIKEYHNIFVDLDAKRPQGISSNAQEKQAALNAAIGIREFSRTYLMWPEPMLADSGNGYHLVYKAFFESTPETTELVKNFLNLMHDLFCIDPQIIDGQQIQVNVDSTVFNPGRLIKLHGTTARKGDPTSQRPHRPSYVMEGPSKQLQTSQGVVTRTMLDSAVGYMAKSLGKENEIAAAKNLPAGATDPIPGVARRPGVKEMFTKIEGIEPIMQGGKLDVQQWLLDNGRRVIEIKDGPAEGVKLYVLEQCLFDPTHGRGEAAIVQGSEGQLSYKCFHDTCTNDPERKWAAARNIVSGSAGLGKWMAGGSFGVVFPHVNNEGKPYPRFGNFQALLRGYDIKLRHNKMNRYPESELPGGLWKGNDRILTLTRAYLVELCTKHGLAYHKLETWIAMETAENEYHPVDLYVQKKAWDGVDRFGELANTVTVPKEQYHMWRLYLRKWLIQLIAAVYHPNFSGKGVLTFTGDQNTGKTSWLRSLLPEELNAFCEGAHLDPAIKDTLLSALSCTIVELGELDATFKKADVSRLKAFISSAYDRIRVPYGREVEIWNRQTIFAATVNDPQFLVDATGNSRWWVVHAMYINWRHTVDMQQVLAQAFHCYMEGESWHLTEEETDRQTELNSQFEIANPLEEKLMASFQFDTMQASWNNQMTATQILEHIGTTNPKRADTTQLGILLVKRVGPSKRLRIDGVRSRYYQMPPIRNPYAASGGGGGGGAPADIIPFGPVKDPPS